MKIETLEEAIKLVRALANVDADIEKLKNSVSIEFAARMRDSELAILLEYQRHSPSGGFPEDRGDEIYRFVMAQYTGQRYAILECLKRMDVEP